MRTYPWFGFCVIPGLLAAACAPDFEHLGTEVSQVCVRDVPLAFDGASAQQGAAVARVSLTSAGLVPDELQGGTVTLDSIELFAGPEIQSFGFADRVQVSLTPPELALVDMQGVAAAPSLYVSGDPDLDITGHLLARDASMELMVTGRLPGTAWTARLDICLAVDGVSDADDSI